MEAIDVVAMYAGSEPTGDLLVWDIKRLLLLAILHVKLLSNGLIETVISIMIGIDV